MMTAWMCTCQTVHLMLYSVAYSMYVSMKQARRAQLLAQHVCAHATMQLDTKFQVKHLAVHTSLHHSHSPFASAHACYTQSNSGHLDSDNQRHLLKEYFYTSTGLMARWHLWPDAGTGKPLTIQCTLM